MSRQYAIIRSVHVTDGGVAQLGERGNRTAEVRGSIPLISTFAHYFLCSVISYDL